MDEVFDTCSFQVVHTSRSTATINIARPFSALKAGIAYSAYSSSLEQITTISAFAAIAASTPASTVSNPQLQLLHNRTSQEVTRILSTCLTHCQISDGSHERFRTFADASVFETQCFKRLAARSNTRVSTSFSQV